MLTRLEGELDKLEHVLPKELMEGMSMSQGETKDSDSNKFLLSLKRQDPSRVIYNALLPFLVAVIENFFRDCFEILLKYDDTAQAALCKQTKKIEYSEVVQVRDGTLTLERIVSNWYSFQNLNNIQKAYQETLGIDVWRVLRKRRRIRSKLPLLSAALQSLIDARHGVVHHFVLDRELDRDGLLTLMHLVRSLMQAMRSEFERKLGVAISAG